MRRVRGSDNGVLIRDKKNLTGYRSNVDFGTVVTRIMPQGFDGLLLPEKYIDSPLIGNYLTPRIRVIKYDNVKAAVGQYADDEDAIPLPEAYALLRNLAAKEYNDNHIDKPNATYNVKFAPLERTEEYKNFAVLEKIAIGDVVKVVHEEDNLDISARMVSYKYNPFTESYISITLGNFSPKFTDISKTIQRIETNVNQANDNANFALRSANGKNTNFYGDEEPNNPREGGGSFISWGYRTGNTGTFSTVLVLDPQAKVRSQAGFHLGIDLCTNGFNFRTSGNRILKMTDLTLTVSGSSTGPFPAWGGDNGRARVCFGTDHLYLVSNNVFCTVTAVTSRISELITRVNQLITRLNNGWMITSTTSYSGTGLTTMPTSLTS